MWVEYRGVIKKGNQYGVFGERLIETIIDWPYICTYNENTGEFNIRLEDLHTFQLQFKPIHKADDHFFEERIWMIIGTIANENNPEIISKVSACKYCKYVY